jgi:hypothetical protein
MGATWENRPGLWAEGGLGGGGTCGLLTVSGVGGACVVRGEVCLNRFDGRVWEGHKGCEQGERTGFGETGAGRYTPNRSTICSTNCSSSKDKHCTSTPPQTATHPPPGIMSQHLQLLLLPQHPLSLLTIPLACIHAPPAPRHLITRLWEPQGQVAQAQGEQWVRGAGAGGGRGSRAGPGWQRAAVAAGELDEELRPVCCSVHQRPDLEFRLYLLFTVAYRGDRWKAGRGEGRGGDKEQRFRVCRDRTAWVSYVWVVSWQGRGGGEGGDK